MTFIKVTYTETQLENRINEIKNSLELPYNYSLKSITGSTTNGLSIYISVVRDGEIKPFIFRVSNHRNGNNVELISDMGTSYQMQGVNVTEMMYFYGDLKRETKEETKIVQNTEKGINDLFPNSKIEKLDLVKVSKKGNKVYNFKVTI